MGFRVSGDLRSIVQRSLECMGGPEKLWHGVVLEIR